MKISLGCDHAGYDYKERIKAALPGWGHEAVDFGTFSPDSCDYPAFVRPAAEAVAAGRCDRGIVLGGSGNGEAIVANKVPGVRCSLCWNVESARLARAHNDANVLSLGQRMMPPETALDIVKLWLESPFDGGRHLRRIEMIEHGLSGGQVAEVLNLKPLPQEGGLFRETYRSTDRARDRRGNEKALSTAIYYLLKAGEHSRLHRLPADEVWHFYLGAPVELLVLDADGRSELILLGADLAAGQRPQAVVPAGAWQGATLQGAGRFALLGTTLAPGFDFADFHPADPAALAAAYPDRKDLILQLA